MTIELKANITKLRKQIDAANPHDLTALRALCKQLTAAKAELRASYDTKPYRLRIRADASTGKAAFVQFYCPATDRYLWLKRSETGDAPNVWAGPGGGVEYGESIVEGLRRELSEEIGYNEPIDPKPFCRFDRPGFSAYNFVAPVNEEFEPNLNHEHTDYVWSKEPPQPLHPALEEAMREPLFNEHTDNMQLQACLLTAASTIDDDNPFPVDAAFDVDSGVSWDAFKSWTGAMKRKYLGEHPQSTFYEKMGMHAPEDQPKVDKHKADTQTKQKPHHEAINKLDKAIKKERDPEKRKKLEDEREGHFNSVEQLDNEHDDFKDDLHEKRREQRDKEKANPNGGLMQRRSKLVAIKKAMKLLSKKIKHYMAQYERAKKGKDVRSYGDDKWSDIAGDKDGNIYLKSIRKYADTLRKQYRDLHTQYERLRDDVHPA